MRSSSAVRIPWFRWFSAGVDWCILLNLSGAACHLLRYFISGKLPNAHAANRFRCEPLLPCRRVPEVPCLLTCFMWVHMKFRAGRTDCSKCRLKLVLVPNERRASVVTTPTLYCRAPGLSFGTETNFWQVLRFYLVSPGQGRDSILNETTTASFHILYLLIFADHPVESVVK